jgi:bromodomain-containing factor 1
MSLQIGDDGTLELDIDAISVPTLWKIYNMVIQHAPQVEPELRRQFQERDAPRAPAKPATKKKNKPMSKVEQERKIEQLKSAVQDFERQGSGSQEPLPSKSPNLRSKFIHSNYSTAVENHDDSSGDEDSDSEEE